MVCPGGCFLCYASAPILMHLRTPAENERGSQHAEHVIADLMAANTRGRSVSLVYTTSGSETLLALDVASSLLTPLKRSLAAHYPGVRVSQPGATTTESGEKHSLFLRLVPDTRSLRVTADFEDQLQRTLTEPISGLLAAVADRGEGLHASLRFSLEPCSPRQRRRARRVASLAAGPLARWLPAFVDEFAKRANGSLWERLAVLPFSFLGEGEVPDDTTGKLNDHLYRVTIELRVVAPREKSHLAQKRLASLAAAFSPFETPGCVAWRVTRKPVCSLLSTAELATLWHPPVSETHTDSMQAAGLPHLPPPVELVDCSKEEGVLPLGKTVVGVPRLVGVLCEDRLHQLVIGKSGMGKSTLLHTQAAADIEQGRGVGLVDPHGDLVADLLKTIRTDRTNEIVVIDPTSSACPRIQPLACRNPSQRALVAENNLAALSKVFGFDESSAPRLLHILRFTLLALVGSEQGSFLSIRPMLTDKKFRKRIVDRCEDEEVRSFWRDEVGSWSERYEQEAMPAILNKTGQFTAHPDLRRLFGDPVGDIDLRELMDDGKIVLISLSQGVLGEQAARFAGSVLMANFQNAAMTRADLDKSDRRPFYLYADEYATFVNSSFADLLAQARKYGLFLTAAQQTTTQVDRVDPAIMDAMFGNLATLVTFQVSQKDAQRLADELASDATPADLMQLPKYHAIVRTAIHGVPSRPFLVQTLPPPVKKKMHANPEVIQRQLRRRYGRSKTTVGKSNGKGTARK